MKQLPDIPLPPGYEWSYGDKEQYHTPGIIKPSIASATADTVGWVVWPTDIEPGETGNLVIMTKNEFDKTRELATFAHNELDDALQYMAALARMGELL